MQIAIITGEASGDRVGGQLACELRRLRPGISLWGTGGKYLREAGAEVVIETSHLGIVGAVQALSIAPTIAKSLAAVKRELLRRQPDVLVAVDAGALHTGFGVIEGLLPWLRRNLPQTRVLYYFPPSSWRQSLKGTRLGPITDAVATPFPWSASELRRLGVENVEFVGHPLLDLVKPEEPVEVFAERVGLDRSRPVVGLLPGSRRQEIDQILPIQLDAAALIQRRVPGVQFLLGLAPTVERERIVAAIEAQKRRNERRSGSSKSQEDGKRKDLAGRPLPSAVGTNGQRVRYQPDDMKKRLLTQLEQEQGANRSHSLPLAIVENATYDVMAASDVLIVTSGTATLEAAILGRPMAILYRLSLNNFLQYLIVRKSLPPYIGMPNIIADAGIVPEFVQDAAQPAAIASEVIGLLLEPDRILKMRESLQKVIRVLGEHGGAGRAAEMAIALAEGRPLPHWPEQASGSSGIKEGV